MTAGPACAVIIPSRQRATELDRILGALAEQTVDPATFEVAVVLDGSTDRSMEVLRRWECSGRLPRLRWSWQEHAGAARARNTGVDSTEAPVVLFLDDDVVPEADLVERHLDHHGRLERVAVLGNCPVVADRSRPHVLHVWSWWEDYYAQRATPGREPNYQDFATGNASVRRADFEAAGRFDERFERYGGEDFDLGYRLLRTGVTFVTDPRACAPHVFRKTVGDLLEAARDEAAGDVLMGSKHPELRTGLRLARGPQGRGRFLVRLAFLAAPVADAYNATRRARLSIYERLGFRGRWCRTFKDLRTYAYWRGVVDAFGSWGGLRTFQEGARRPRWTVDVTDGLPRELPPIGQGAVSEVDVTVGKDLVGTVVVPATLPAPARNVLASTIAGRLGAELAAKHPMVSADVQSKLGVLVDAVPNHLTRVPRQPRVTRNCDDSTPSDRGFGSPFDSVVPLPPQEAARTPEAQGFGAPREPQTPTNVDAYRQEFRATDGDPGAGRR